MSLTEQMFSKLNNKTIIVKGHEKVQWLEYMFRLCGPLNCINIDDLSIQYNCRENDAYHFCEHHRWINEGSLAVCAKNNAMNLQDFVNKNVNALVLNEEY